jgi:excisionase family DNA binding protein
VKNVPTGRNAADEKTARGQREKTSGISLVASSERSATSAEWLTAAQAAQRIAVNVEFIYDACAKRGLKHLRLLGPRGIIRISTDSLDDWLSQFQQENR